MAKLDETKEHIGALKGYLNILTAIILTIGAGISRLYLIQNINVLFWSGISLIILLLVVFYFIGKKIHKDIKSLKDL